MNRDAIIIGVACLIAILLGGWLFLSNPSEKPTGGEVEITVLAEGQNSGSITTQKNFRIQNAEKLAELWRLVYGESDDLIPAVNFERNEVLAVFDGTHSSGGYSIEVSSVVDENGIARRVAVTRRTPGESCVTTQAITSPFQIVVLPISSLPIVRTDASIIVSCD